MESLSVSVSPLPLYRSLQDDDALVGHRDGAGRRVGVYEAARPGDPVAWSGVSTEAGSLTRADVVSPAMQAEEGRGPIGALHEARDQAARIGVQLDGSEAAVAGLSQVQKLVARLNDMAVVGLGRGLPPGQRATLQRQVDQALHDIDTIASETLVDDSILRGRFVADATDEPVPPTPFRSIGVAALGLDGLAVRSPDQALAATSALDLAASRLQRSARLLGSATDRLQDALIGLTSPPTTASGDPSLGNASTALGFSMLLRNQVLGSPDLSLLAQGSLDTARVGWLLDTSSR
jgi:ElaB/YqjD/DUF883 family membrane-anchored ribosome-binding protein